MLTTVRAGAEAYELVKAGAIDGLSIGFSTVKSIDRNGKRVILQADLWEVSLVTFPMNEMARIDAVKAAGLSERELERMLTRDAGLSRSVALALMGGGYNGIKAMRDAGDDGAEEVASLLRLRTSL
jgi:phage head maturation protease